MAKFSGSIGFAIQGEIRPGVWSGQIVEHHYTGDLIRNTLRLQSADKVSDDIVVSNEISIIADAFANENFHSIRYVVFRGAKWKVASVEVLPPRLKLTLGGVYNVANSEQT